MKSLLASTALIYWTRSCIRLYSTGPAIFISSAESDIRLRFRIDGMMYQVAALEREVHPQLISRLKILAGMDIAEKRLPQDGRFTFEASHGKVDCRVSTMPVQHGERR